MYKTENGFQPQKIVTSLVTETAFDAGALSQKRRTICDFKNARLGDINNIERKWADEPEHEPKQNRNRAGVEPESEPAHASVEGIEDAGDSHGKREKCKKYLTGQTA